MQIRPHSAGINRALEQLPVPGPEARAQSEALIRHLRMLMGEHSGRLPFDLYMEQVLYAPGLGYYSGGAHKFGEQGDFITAPELSPLFGRCLARQCLGPLQVLESPAILEFGAGTGALAADLLRELQQLERLPERYLILELSAELRQRQRETLARKVPDLLPRVEWLDALPPSGLQAVVLANELIDAMPVSRFRLCDGRIEEQYVVESGEGFALQWGEVSTPGLEAAVRELLAEAGPRPEGFESEIQLRSGPWLQLLAERLERGLVLLIDYGYSRSDYYHPAAARGTLMCYYRHRAHDDPLVYPGLQDITAHVDFTALARQALSAGFAVSGYTTQAFFLMGCGLDHLVAQSDPEDLQRHLPLMQQVKRLTLPTEMGERFKVLGLTLGLDLPLCGFAMRDMRERL